MNRGDAVLSCWNWCVGNSHRQGTRMAVQCAGIHDETGRMRPGDGTSMTPRVYNFSAGPAVLPEPVLAEAQRDLMALPGVGASILEISHRSPTFENIIQQAETN